MKHLSNTITQPTKFDAEDLIAGIDFVYEPGNGTRFDIVMIWMPATGRILVAIHNMKKCFHFSPGTAHESYVEEKLGLLPGDAEQIAKLINAQ